MLSNHSVNAIYDLACQASQNNLQLLVKDESPLTALINASVSPSMHSGMVTAASDPGAPTSVTSFLGASRMKGPEGVSEHDLVMDELVETVASAVSRNLAWARNEVAPMVTSIYDNAVRDVAAASSRGPIPLTVLPYFYSAIWDRTEIQEMAAQYAETPLKSISLSLQVALPEGKTLLEVLDTGLAGVNSAVAELIHSRGEGLVEGVYQSVFGEHRLPKLIDVLGQGWSSNDVAVVVMLLANALGNHVPEGLNISLDGYKAYMIDIMAQAAAQCARVLNRRDEHLKTLRLVIDRPYGSNPRGNITVVGDVYNAWLREGGSPEILMGAVMSGRNDEYDVLLREKEVNLQTYASIAESLKSELQYAKYNALIASFRTSVTTLINNLPEDKLQVPRSVLHQNLTYRLTHVKISDLDNPYIPARKVLCRTLWHHTDVERYLEAIDAAAAAHPTLDVREAGLFAALDVLVEWLNGQITAVEAK